MFDDIGNWATEIAQAPYYEHGKLVEDYVVHSNWVVLRAWEVLETFRKFDSDTWIDVTENFQVNHYSVDQFAADLAAELMMRILTDVVESLCK